MAQAGHNRIAILGTILHLGLAACLFVQLVITVPSAKKTFDEYGLTLPWLSLSVIRLSNWFAAFWWVVAPFPILFAAGQYFVLSRRTEGSWYKMSWVIGVGTIMAFAVFVIWFAMELPMVKLREGLAK